jgi:UDP-glucose 4-epimerase
VIIGSEGFIGRELRRHCATEGIEVVGVDSVASTEPGLFVADIRDGDIAAIIPADATAVVHLAAISRDRDCARDPMSAIEVNVVGALRAHEATVRQKVPQFIFASSEWTYGETVGAEPQTEDSPIVVSRLTSEYALTKLMAERFLFFASKRAADVAVTVLRFGIVYGPRPTNWSAVEQLLHAVGSGETVELHGSARSARRFIHVSDVAAGILRAVGRKGYEVFNLTGDRLVTLSDVIAESAALLGVSPTVVERDPSAVSVRNPDNSRARSALGWEPRISLREGLASLLGPS